MAGDVTGAVSVTSPSGPVLRERGITYVIWLTPLTDQPTPAVRTQGDQPPPRLVQKNKLFEPHVLAVRVGSVVDFPNRDPFFHNVFSLFDGKRFDLGLYEAGATRSVRFDRAGVCYIFCNIHSEMSAVIVVVDTPYFIVVSGRRAFRLANVPPGQYQLELWEEHCAPQTLKSLSRPVSVGPDTVPLASVHLQQSADAVTAHLNKYGQPYDPQVFSSPLYLQP